MEDIITLAHGSGGKAMQRLISETFAQYFSELGDLDDYAVLSSDHDTVFSTDSFVITPRQFHGGDIGKLAVLGSCNDVAMSGARPSHLACAFIIEEGFFINELKDIVKSMADTAKQCQVRIVTGDTKVVPKGAVDGLFINTTALGSRAMTHFSQRHIQPGDKIIVSRDVGRHGACIADLRNELGLDYEIESDCASLTPLVQSVAHLFSDIRYFRDATRGGLAAVLNELAAGSECQFDVIESKIPVDKKVTGLCDILGLDPFYLANEGTLVCVVSDNVADEIVNCFKEYDFAKDACIIGEVVKGRSGRVTIESMLGVQRMLDMPEGELLPRIC